MVTAKVIPVAVVCLVLFSALVILMELEVVQLGTAGESHQNVEGLFEPATLGQSYISFNPATKIRLPNQGRSRGECVVVLLLYVLSVSIRTCFLSSDIFTCTLCVNGGFWYRMHLRHLLLITVCIHHPLLLCCQI